MRLFRIIFGVEPEVGSLYELFRREYRVVGIQQGRVMYERANIYGEFKTPRCEPMTLSVREFHTYGKRLPTLVRP